jgi:PAS domain S-box-containing protein
VFAGVGGLLVSSLVSGETVGDPEGVGRENEQSTIAIRIVWIVAAALLVGLFVYSLPYHTCNLLKGFDSILPSAAGIGLSSRGYTTYAIAVETTIVLAYVIAGGAIFWQQPRNPLALFFSLTLVAFGVIFVPAVYALERASPASYTLVRVVRMLANTGFLILVAYTFPDGNFVPKWTGVLAVIWIVRNAIVVFLPGSLLSTETWPTLPWVLETVFWAGTAIYAQGYRYNRVSTPTQRQQTKWLIFGLVMGVIAFVGIYMLPTIPSAIAPPGPERGLLAIAIPAIAAAFAIFLPASIAVSFLRYRLWDIDFLTNRTLVYGTLILLLACLYILLLRGLTLIVQVLYRGNDTVAVFLATLIITLAFEPLRQRVRTIVDRVFYRTRPDYQQLLPEISAELATKLVFSDLAKLLIESLPRRLQIAGAMVLTYVPDRKAFAILPSQDTFLPIEHPLVSRLSKADRPILLVDLDPHEDADLLTFMHEQAIAISIPLRRGTMLIGAYNLGPKLSGASYNQDDMRFLSVLVRQVAISLENAHLYEELRVHRDHLADLVEKHTTQIRNEQQKLAAVLANVGDAIIIIGADSLIEYVNNAWTRQSGYAPQDILGTNVCDLFIETFPPEEDEEFTKAMQLQEVWRGEATHHRKSGKPFPVDLAVSALHDKDGVVTNYVISQRDITLQKEIDRFKSDFISDVSHQLSAPITNLKLYLGLLETGPPEKRDRYIETLKSESARLERLVKDLMQLLKLEQGAIPLDIQPLDLNELARSVVTAYQEMATEKALTVEMVTTRDVPPVPADWHRIEQALTNLLVNAITYTNSGGTITVEVGMAQREDSRFAIIAVRDTGIGIPLGEQAAIFTRFYRATSATRTEIPGTGLGLAIVKQIAVMHNGTITVQSQPDVGSTFTLWLPILNEDPE